MTALTGFIYVPCSKPSPVLTASVGDVVALPNRRPPWMIVDHTLAKVLVVGWPGQLWRAQVTDAATAADGAGGLVADAGYTRAVAVRLIEVLEPASLFGPNGDAVAAILDAVDTMGHDDAVALADAVDDAAGEVFSGAWNAWLQAEGRSDSIHHGANHHHTLAVPARGRAMSPINGGFSVLCAQLRQRALVVDGDNAFFIEQDEDGDTEERLAEPWCHAQSALLHALMAVGAPALLTDADRDLLARPWRSWSVRPTR